MPFWGWVLLLCTVTVHATPASTTTLAVCTDASPDGFDVVQYNSLVTTNASADVLMNRLLDFDAQQGTLIPSLATRWEVSPDGLNYTFHLRPNVAFQHNARFTPTRPFNADDVLFTFSRMLDPQNPWHRVNVQGFPHAQSMQLAQRIKQIVRVNDSTVRFELSAPDATFLPMLTMGFASIYSAEYAHSLLVKGEQARLNSEPLGTGPFILRQFQRGSFVRYVANPDYFAGKPALNQLVYVIVPDPTVRLQKLKAGECQIALAPKPQDVASARANPALHVLETPAFMTAFVAINSSRPPFNDVRVRQALNMAFDRKHYLSAVFGNSAIAATEIYPPNTWSYATLTPYPYDPEQAKRLLASAGLTQGFATTIWVRPGGSVLNPAPQAGVALLQADLARIGVRTNIQVLEWGELIKRAKAGEHDLLFMGWSGDNGDPDNFLTPQFSCAAVQSGTNFARYCDPRLDQWINAGRSGLTQAARTQDYLAAQNWIHQQALWIPLAHPTLQVLTSARVSGYKVNPYGRQDFSKVVLH